MPPMTTFSRAVFTASAFAALSVACSSGGSAPAHAYLSSTLGMSTAPGAAMCNLANPGAPWVVIGTEALPVANQDFYSSNGVGNQVTVICSVTAMGSGYLVNAFVGLGPNGAIGTVQIDGTLNDIAGPQPGIHASFGKLNSSSYNENDCTVTLTTQQTPAITSGRVWGTLSCPTLMGQSYTCAATATFILQDCSG